MRPHIPTWSNDRALGAGIVLVLVALAILATMPLLEAHTERQALMAEQEFRIAQLEERVSEPSQEDPNLELLPYIAPGLDPASFTPRFQEEVIGYIRAAKARLVEFRALPSRSDIDALQGLSFRLAIEGDWQALLECLSRMSQTSYPIIIDELSIVPRPINDRADRRLRLTIQITIWTDQQVQE